MNRVKVLMVMGTVFCSMLVFYLFFMGDFNLKASDASDEVEITEEENTVLVEEPVEEPIEVDEDALSKVEEEFPLSMGEVRVQNAIHHMSHAFVWAAEKRGHLEPTQERIDRLLVVVKENSEKYKHAKLYEEILTRWQAGDFSKAVSDHNAIWALQSGEVGKALRLFTEKERREYAEKHFK